MADIAKIIETTPEGPTFALRHDAYRPGEAQELIADVVSLANAPGGGKRYIVFGVETPPGSAERRVTGIPELPNTRMWQQLVREYIEPEISIEYRMEKLGGRNVGVLIVPPCAQPPYVVKRTLGALERGASFVRRERVRDRLMRADLEAIYARRYDPAARFAGLQVGFTAEVPVDTLELRRQSDAELPSHEHTSKLRELIDARSYVDRLNGSGDSGIVRMVHVRLFGADVPYESKSLAQLQAELEAVRDAFREQDRHARYERDAARVNLTVVNDGAEPLEDTALVVHFPVARGFEVVAGPGAQAAAGHVAGRHEGAAAVSLARPLGRIEPGTRMEAFPEPLRVVLTAHCRHRVLPVRYELRAANLPYPMKGKLRFETV
jgi:hypothetical protein